MGGGEEEGGACRAGGWWGGEERGGGAPVMVSQHEDTMSPSGVRSAKRVRFQHPKKKSEMERVGDGGPAAQLPQRLPFRGGTVTFSPPPPSIFVSWGQIQISP